MRNHPGDRIACLMVIFCAACNPAAPTRYIDELYEMPLVPVTAQRERVYDIDVRHDGIFSMTLEAWTWGDSDYLEVELRNASVGTPLALHRSCDPWSAFLSMPAKCDSVVRDLPVSFSARVAAGRKLQLRVSRAYGPLGFRLRVNRPE